MSNHLLLPLLFLKAAGSVDLSSLFGVAALNLPSYYVTFKLINLPSAGFTSLISGSFSLPPL